MWMRSATPLSAPSRPASIRPSMISAMNKEFVQDFEALNGKIAAHGVERDQLSGTRSGSIYDGLDAQSRQQL